MSLTEAMDQYKRALKQGQKDYRADVLRGRYPYPQVLDEILVESMCAGRVDLGLIEIPINQIVGTKSAGRKSAFASSFMPLLPIDTEFGAKWVKLCEAHLGDEGIRDPIKCYEYLGRFYVEEGNKRVSVLKSYGATTIPGTVIRMLPAESQDLAVQRYYEFVKFYQLAGLYQVQFLQLGSFAKLQAALGYEPGHIWTKEERQSFLSGFTRFKDAFSRQGGDSLSVTPAGALLVWLRVNPFSDLKTMTASELTKSITAVWPDIQLLAQGAPVSISTVPPTPEKGGILSKILDSKPTHLNIAFVHTSNPAESSWTRAHDAGREHLEKAMGDRISVVTYLNVRSSQEADRVMEEAVAEGADVIIATAPPLIGACRKVAAKHPGLKVLNCSLDMPYAGLRTYYSRMYESKFITGAIAGAMARENTIGYVANYPIFGVPAGINAFALGAQMVNPQAKLLLHWSCTEGDPKALFQARGVTVVSNRESPAPELAAAGWGWGVSQYTPDGKEIPLAAPCWNWGTFYEKAVDGIFTGAWDQPREGGQAVNYWWGMDSGVIDVQLSPTLPAGVKRLALLLKQAIIDRKLDPFGMKILDQEGNVRCDGETPLTPEEIVRMDWLCQGVEGRIPSFDELLPMSRNMVRLLGLYRDTIEPEAEGVLL